MENPEKQIRHYIFQTFLETARPPQLEEIMNEFGLEREAAAQILQTLEANKSVALLAGTQRILMAFPFSAVATPFVVKLDNGKQYFANCAWDAVAFHVMLQQPLQIDSFCHQSGELIKVRIGPGGEVDADPPHAVVFLSRPASQWWQNIIDTCSNTMVFFSKPQHLERWQADHPLAASGQTLSIEQTIKLSGPLYKDRMSMDYERPSADRLRQHFAQLDLAGSFWQI